jgi:hypothetical protein
MVVNILIIQKKITKLNPSSGTDNSQTDGMLHKQAGSGS